MLVWWWIEQITYHPHNRWDRNRNRHRWPSFFSHKQWSLSRSGRSPYVGSCRPDVPHGLWYPPEMWYSNRFPAVLFSRALSDRISFWGHKNFHQIAEVARGITSLINFKGIRNNNVISGDERGPPRHIHILRKSVFSASTIRIRINLRLRENSSLETSSATSLSFSKGSSKPRAGGYDTHQVTSTKASTSWWQDRFGCYLSCRYFNFPYQLFLSLQVTRLLPFFQDCEQKWTQFPLIGQERDIRGTISSTTPSSRHLTDIGVGRRGNLT